DHELAGLGRKLRLDGVDVLALAADAAVGRMYAAGVGVARGIDHRDAGASRGSEQLLRPRQRFPGVLAAGARELAVDLGDRPAAALISLVVQVDGEYRRVVADIELAAVGLVDLDGVGIDDVLPAMVFEIARHLAWLRGKVSSSATADAPVI